MDACFSSIITLQKLIKKTYHSFYWIQVVGDEWPERLFTLPRWIMKNMVNLVPLSKHILNSDYGKSIVPHIVAMSKYILCDGHLLLYSPLFRSGWPSPIPSHIVWVGLVPYASLEVDFAWLKVVNTSHLQDQGTGFKVGI